jgi:hypothetical protein
MMIGIRQKKKFGGVHAPVEKIVFDITALAPLVAERLHVPSIAVTNFTWDWIYEPYVEQFPEFDKYINLHVESYAKTNLYLELPYSNVSAALRNCETKPIEWVVRSAKCPKQQVINTLQLAVQDQTNNNNNNNTNNNNNNTTTGDKNIYYCLYSFGGHEFPLEKLSPWDVPPEWRVVLVDKTSSSEAKPTHKRTADDRVIIVSQFFLDSVGITYVDLVAAMDVVVCKTGYGIVSECIRHGVSVLYTDRPGFIEHSSLERALKENVSCDQVDLDEVVNASASLWQKARAIIPNCKQSKFGFDGARTAAQFIFDYYCSNQ